MQFHVGPRRAEVQSAGGRRRSTGILCAACFCCALAIVVDGSPAVAQPPGLNATGPKVQTIQHNGLSEPQPFPEVRWIVISPQSRRGAVVEMACAAFANTLDASQRVDTRLDLRVIQSVDRADWTVATPTDQSDIAHGQEFANTFAVSRDRGNGQLGIVVTFVNFDFTQLTTGEYETTLVGTITEN